jgi:hypothetical protein
MENQTEKPMSANEPHNAPTMTGSGPTTTTNNGSTPTTPGSDGGGSTGGGGDSSPCACDTSTGGGDSTNTPAPTPVALISADIAAGLSGVQASADVLGKGLADVSIGLGTIDSILGLVHGLPCGDGGGSTAPAQSAPLLAAAVSADLSGVHANADVLGHDTVDASIGLGALDPVLGLVDSKLGLVDSGSDLADGLLCDIV